MLDALYSLGSVLCVLLVHVSFAIGFTAFFFAIECQLIQTDDETLTGDLRLINALYNIEWILKNPPIDAVQYYEQTTDRDYALLEYIMGPGMHTRLGNDNAKQFEYVMREIQEVNATHVLEIGCGKGHSRVLAQMMPSVQFTGIDMVKRHIDIAKSRAVANVEYFHADATKNLSWLGEGKFQVIFGVESLCHMDSKEAREGFMRQVKTLLAPGGRLVIVDGFRSKNFADASPDQQMAMMLAERGFSIARMPSKADWIEAGQGLVHFASTVDLTDDALQYWTLGWRVARFLLCFPLVLYYFSQKSLARKCSLMNVLSAATVAHAMRDSAAAEYGVLVVS
jgi:SAM-dependent methyltransferase